MDRPLGLEGLDDKEDAEENFPDGSAGAADDLPTSLQSLQQTMKSQILVTLGAVFIAVLVAVGVFAALGASGSVAIFGGILAFFVAKILVILAANVVIVRLLLGN